MILVVYDLKWPSMGRLGGLQPSAVVRCGYVQRGIGSATTEAWKGDEKSFWPFESFGRVLAHCGRSVIVMF